MYKFIDLCVTLSRKSHARLGLLTFKNATQSTAVQSIENVLNHFIAAAENRLTVAVEQARVEVDALPENPVVDDELPLQPTAMLYDSFVDQAGDRDRIERRLIAPAQRFCWDAYDICLDIAKGNDRLEVIYQSLAHRAFNFCKIHERKSDFRRLCEQRLAKGPGRTPRKYGHQQHSVNLQDPETLSRHLDTRFLQLETAVELELWQEAFRSVEDIHALVAGKENRQTGHDGYLLRESSLKSSKQKGGDTQPYSTPAAWSRYLQFAERAGQVPEKAPGCVLLSALRSAPGCCGDQAEAHGTAQPLANADSRCVDSRCRCESISNVSLRPSVNYTTVIEIDFQPLNSGQGSRSHCHCSSCRI